MHQVNVLTTDELRRAIVIARSQLGQSKANLKQLEDRLESRRFFVKMAEEKYLRLTQLLKDRKERDIA